MARQTKAQSESTASEESEARGLGFSAEDVPAPDYSSLPPHLVEGWAIQHFRDGDQHLSEATQFINTQRNFAKALRSIEKSLSQFSYMFETLKVTDKFEAPDADNGPRKKCEQHAKALYNTCRILQQHLYTITQAQSEGIDMVNPIPEYPGTRLPTAEELSDLSAEQIEKLTSRRSFDCASGMVEMAQMLQDERLDDTITLAHRLLCDLDHARCFLLAATQHENFFDLRFTPLLARIGEQIMSLRLFQGDSESLPKGASFVMKPDPTKLH